jgi:hypothetical protein
VKQRRRFVIRNGGGGLILELLAAWHARSLMEKISGVNYFAEAALGGRHGFFSHRLNTDHFA